MLSMQTRATTAQVVLLPIAAGAWLNHSFPGAMRRAAPFAPLLAASMTVLVSARIIAQHAAAMWQAGPRLLAAVFALHLGGFVLGYAVSRLLRVPERQARTNSIEVGMQVGRVARPMCLLMCTPPCLATGVLSAADCEPG